jgi:tetratricopeptide (TPR) repeat protein
MNVLSQSAKRRPIRGAEVFIAIWICAPIASVFALQGPEQHPQAATIQGTVRDANSKPVEGALVRIKGENASELFETRSDANGVFEFSGLRTGRYDAIAEKSTMRSGIVSIETPAPSERDMVDLVLARAEDGPKQDLPKSNAASAHPEPLMEFADEPSFTIAGVTDWTAVGGHGSDSILRTSEALARETLALKSADPDAGSGSPAKDSKEASEAEFKLRTALSKTPGSFDANHQLGEFYLHAGDYQQAVPLLKRADAIDPDNQNNLIDLALALVRSGDYSQARQSIQKLSGLPDNSNVHRLTGELDESLGDSLSAVREFEQAVHLDPSEQSYFDWGSELLLHRAVWQAQEVLKKGVRLYPKSARMLTALGTALFAGALYDEAARTFCDASDLNPLDPAPYLFMGKTELAAPNPSACMEKRLGRFVQQHPERSDANYLYAMAVWKRQQQSPGQTDLQQVEALLARAVALDSKCSDAYMELGVLYSSRHDFEKAIDYYTRAIEANPELGEAHFRLGVAYDRTGKKADARQEFAIHDQLEKREADAVERQRQDIKQFLIIESTQQPFPQVR